MPRGSLARAAPEGMRLGLKADRIVKRFETPAGPLLVLDEVVLALDPGESVAISGPSGSGKSTLLNIIGGLEPPTSGSVWLDDVEVTKLGETERARFRNRRVGFVFQDHHLLPQCTALENVLVPTLVGEGDREASKRARALLERVGLPDKAEAFPSELSGGQRQRVAVARALMNDPTLLLCDEPTGNLDQESGDRMGDLFMELVRERNAILILVTHNLGLAGRFQRRAELKAGRLRFEQ